MASPREVLVEVLKDVEEANVPDDLREIAFSKTFDLRAGTAAANSAAPSPPGTKTSRTLTGDTDPLANIAARYGIDATTVAEVYAIENGKLELIVPLSKLPKASATGTKEIALLIAGGRQAGGIEEWTSWEEIRDACVEFKKYDAGNFAKTMHEMDDVFNQRRHSERKYLVKLARPGWDRLGEAIRRLGGE
jgi:hypothetical protein